MLRLQQVVLTYSKFYLKTMMIYKLIAYDVAIELVSGSSEATNITAKEFQVLETKLDFQQIIKHMSLSLTDTQTAYIFNFKV